MPNGTYERIKKIYDTLPLNFKVLLQIRIMHCIYQFFGKDLVISLRHGRAEVGLECV